MRVNDLWSSEWRVRLSSRKRNTRAQFPALISTLDLQSHRAQWLQDLCNSAWWMSFWWGTIISLVMDAVSFAWSDSPVQRKKHRKVRVPSSDPSLFGICQRWQDIPVTQIRTRRWNMCHSWHNDGLMQIFLQITLKGSLQHSTICINARDIWQNTEQIWASVRISNRIRAIAAVAFYMNCVLCSKRKLICSLSTNTFPVCRLINEPILDSMMF